MKKYILYVIAVLIAFSSCKKDVINKNNSNNLSHVFFKVGYVQSTGNFSVSNKSARLTGRVLAATSGSDSVLSANSNVLYVAVYQSDGSRLYLTKQLATDTAYGKINYNLPQGTYTVVFAAGQTGLIVSPYFNGKLSADAISYFSELTNEKTDYSFKDTFFQKITITVGPNGISQSVTLNRIVSEIVLNIEDAIPQNVKFIGMYVTDTSLADLNPGYPYFNFAPATGTDDGFLYVTTPPNIAVTTGVKNFKLCLIVLNNAKPYTVRVFATNTLPGGTLFNPENTLPGDGISDIVINNVTVQANHQTILSGKLFGGNSTSNSGGFNITINPVWDPSVTTIPFQ